MCRVLINGLFLQCVSYIVNTSETMKSISTTTEKISKSYRK